MRVFAALCSAVLVPKSYCPTDDKWLAGQSGHIAMPNSIEWRFGVEMRELLHRQRTERLLLAQTQQAELDALHAAQKDYMKEQLLLRADLSELKSAV